MRYAVLLTLLLSAPGLQAQSRREEFLNITSWRGSFNMKVDRSGLDDKVKWHYQGTARGDLLYDTADLANSPPRWLGKIQNSSVNIRADTSYSDSDCTTTVVYLVNGPLDPPRRGAETEVRVYLNVWEVALSRAIFTGTLTETTVCPGGTFTRVSNPAGLIPNLSSLQTPYPAQGFDLNVSGQALANSGLSHPNSLQLITWDVSVTLSPVVDELMLEVTSPDYETWRPTAEPGPQPGKPIQFTAIVKRASGEPAQVEINRFTWELTGTSREPGIALNFPVNADDNDPDLKLDPQPGQSDLSGDGQKVERFLPPGVEDRAVVLPYDWGGWSTLQVSAYLRDGRKLVGKLKGSPEEGVRLPKRAKDSYIADNWKKDEGVYGADLDDNETEPAGEPGCDGDGLTLYEEYRGFYENGKHLEGDPAKKDFFILNRIGADADGGLEVFSTQTGLTVHQDLLAAEFDENSRIVNANHKQGPHRNDQHGVVLVSSDGIQGGLTSADPAKDRVRWRPGFVTKVEIENPNRPGASYSTGSQVNPIDAFTLYDKTVAHELLHTVGVEHHGRGDGTFIKVFKVTPNEYGRPYFSSAPQKILIFDEQTNEDLALSMEKAAQPFMTRMRQVCVDFGDIIGVTNLDDCVKGAVAVLYTPHFLLGVKNGEHSGNEQCVMRYHFAQFYVVKEYFPVKDFDVWARVPPGTEPSGLKLCDSPAGTGVNAPDRKPQPRYYEANSDEGRGACKTWVCVNDRVPPKSSYSPR